MSNKERVIRAAYTYSEELGKEVEALVRGHASPERLKTVRELVERQFGEDAELVYETIVSVLDPSG